LSRRLEEQKRLEKGGSHHNNTALTDKIKTMLDIFLRRKK